MGLDNIPHVLPCTAQGTAVLVEDSNDHIQRIDCQATQLAGGCPWKNANPPTEGGVIGIFGTDCWYRGKYGNALLDQYTEAATMGDNASFYGDDEDSVYKDPESCLALADLIDEVLADWPTEASDEYPEAHRQGLAYASWYLRWAAANCDGLDAWY